ncbi:MAG: glycosyltransferase [Legionella sp.]|nr:glycosyltransferase [Legionella sp.]
MNLPVISVIMATYNHAKFVSQAIHSVLNQSGVAFEFIISDDGSTDNTREVVSSIKDERIHFFPNEVNRGAGIVTNELIKHASGEFIALINSDDYWVNSNKLAYQLQIMRDNPDIAACFGRARFVDENSCSIEKASLPFGYIFDQENRSQGKWLRYFFDQGNCICHPTMLIRKSCYDELGMYSNRLRQLPDFDMWIRLIKRYPIYISEHELINFRILPGGNASSQSGLNSSRTINEHYLISDNFFNGVRLDDFIDGFSDVMQNKNISNQICLDIEIALLYFIYNQSLCKPYQLLGLQKMNHLLTSSTHHEVLVKAYDIDDLWFQNTMGNVDVLISRIIPAVSPPKPRSLRACQWLHFQCTRRLLQIDNTLRDCKKIVKQLIVKNFCLIKRRTTRIFRRQ